jgi:hypothetical protein
MGRRRHLSSVRGHRTHLNRQPLSGAARVIVVPLDTFVLSSIFHGLARLTVQLAQPEEAVPARCRDIALDLQLTPVGGLERLGELAAASSERLASVTHRRAS